MISHRALAAVGIFTAVVVFSLPAPAQSLPALPNLLGGGGTGVDNIVTVNTTGNPSDPSTVAVLGGGEPITLGTGGLLGGGVGEVTVSLPGSGGVIDVPGDGGPNFPPNNGITNNTTNNRFLTANVDNSNLANTTNSVNPGISTSSSRMKLLMAILRDRAWARFIVGNAICLPGSSAAPVDGWVPQSEFGNLQKLIAAYAADIATLRTMLNNCKSGQRLSFADINRVIGVGLNPDGSPVLYML